MNFDGKAFVKNISIKNFVSSNGSAFVADPRSGVRTFCLTSHQGTALILPVHTSNSKLLNNVRFCCANGLIPYSIQVYNVKETISLKPQVFIKTRNSFKHDEQDFDYDYRRVFVSKLQPANIKYNSKSAIVVDSEQKESALAFAGTTVNVNSKIQIVVPDKITDYSDMSIVVQKNCFIEIKLSDSVIDVTNLPDALMYLPGYIKGTFTQSGEYNVKIKYPDGEQIINIVVPYYQRLL